jgi:acyl dehydratase
MKPRRDFEPESGNCNSRSGTTTEGGSRNLPNKEVQPPMQEWYFDDVPLNQPMTTSEYVVMEEELIAFAKKWDPLPMHTDPEAAKASPHGGLIAPAAYTLAVANALAHRLNIRMPIVGGTEWKARFLAPVRPGDRLIATSECDQKRVSRTKPDRGIARFVTNVQNQKGERVLEFESTILVLRRNVG